MYHCYLRILLAVVIGGWEGPICCQTGQSGISWSSLGGQIVMFALLSDWLGGGVPTTLDSPNGQVSVS